MKKLWLLVVLFGLGCACLHGNDAAIYGKCSDYDYNHDGVVGVPDYTLMMKHKPPPNAAQIAGYEHYFGQKCK